MATLAQLQAEVWWRREFTPPTLSELRIRLLDFWNLAGSAIGVKGNTAHLRGYHRSRSWLINSIYATNRTYSTSETPGNRVPGNSDWLCALDITLPNSTLISVCKRLDTVVRAGVMEKVTEWYGNDDGDNRVDGFNNIRNVVATSDPSHLWHLHMSFDRRKVGEAHDDLYAVLTGDDMFELRQTVDGAYLIYRVLGLRENKETIQIKRPDGSVVDEVNELARTLKRIEDKLVAPVPPEIDVTALVAALTPAIRTILREELDQTRLTG